MGSEMCIRDSDSSFQLIETLAEQLAEIIMIEFKVPWVRLTVHKPGALSNSKDVGVRIERGDPQA